MISCQWQWTNNDKKFNCHLNLREDNHVIMTSVQHAGVSITVTSLTDIFAFGVRLVSKRHIQPSSTILHQTSLKHIPCVGQVGAISRMPGLQSFCVGTAVGLAAIFLIQVRSTLLYYISQVIWVSKSKYQYQRDHLVGQSTNKWGASSSPTMSWFFLRFRGLLLGWASMRSE